MKYVYILQSVEKPEHFYVGLTDDLRERFEAHNAGRVLHTSKYKPCRVNTYVAVSDESREVAFEKCLRTQSGRAFANKRL